MLEANRVGARDDLDAALGEQLGHPLGDGAAEDLQRRVLGGDDDQLGVFAGPVELGPRQQRQLIERQRPAVDARAS